MRTAPILVAVTAALLSSPPARSETVLKIATLAPEGSSWMRLFRTWAAAVDARTEGRVKVRLYSGGIQGDERDVLRKIRLGQLSGAAVTGIGLSSIAPEVRSIERALTYHDLDALRGALDGDLRSRFEERGFVLLGWSDVGPVHLFSQKPVRTLEDLRRLRLWLWTEDPVSRQLHETLALAGVPLGVPDVLPALTTGSVDAFFGSPLSTLALQWSGHVRYMSSITFGQATGALVLAKRAWEEIAAADQKILRQEADAMQAPSLAQVRADNEHSLATLKAHGITLVVPTPELRQSLELAGDAIARANRAGLSKAFAEKVQRVVDSCCRGR